MVHRICELYKNIYALSAKIPKKDKFGIYLKIENILLDSTVLIFTAFFEEKINKRNHLNSARIKIEILKRFIRIMFEINIISDKKYIELELQLQEISKMINGWIKYLKEARF